MAAVRLLALLLAATAGVSANAGAQTPGCTRGRALFPDCHLHATPFADLLAPRVGVDFIHTDLFDRPLVARPGARIDADELDVQMVAALGGAVDVVRLSDNPRRPMTLGLETGVVERFGLTADGNHAIAADWTVGIYADLASGPNSLRLRANHRSAHLGDELAITSGIRRFENDKESLDLGLARRFGPARLYAELSRVVRSNYRDDPGSVHLGAEVESRGRNALGFIAAGEWRWEALPENGGGISLRAGILVRGERHTGAVAFRFHDGAALAGEFFPQRERLWGISIGMR